MKRTAIYIDSGYLCMAVATLLKAPSGRKSVRLKVDAFINYLIAHMQTITQTPLLRIYWYDSCPGGSRKTAEQHSIERNNNIRLRLGTINREGKQKGVDTMLVLDMFEHAMRGMVSDAILLSGDEDLRPGMERTQDEGVRVHLIGLSDDENTNQSNDLIMQADTVTLWNAETIKDFFIIVDSQEEEPGQELSDDVKARLQIAAQESADSLYLEDIRSFKEHGGKGMPADVDGRLLARARNGLNRNLDDSEKRFLRHIHGVMIDTKLGKAGPEIEDTNPLADPSETKTLPEVPQIEIEADFLETTPTPLSITDICEAIEQVEEKK